MKAFHFENRTEVWNIAPKGSNEEIAAADSTVLTAGCCKKLTHDEIYEILKECNR